MAVADDLQSWKFNKIHGSIIVDPSIDDENASKNMSVLCLSKSTTIPLRDFVSGDDKTSGTTTRQMLEMSLFSNLAM